MKITLAQALIKKNQLIAELNEHKSRMIENNSYNVVNVPAYNSAEEMTKVLELTNNLVTLKTQITNANSKIQSSIYELSELKGLIESYKIMSVKKGTHKETIWTSGNDSIVGVEYNATIDELERDKAIDTVKNRIVELQQSINEYNHKTKITV